MKILTEGMENLTACIKYIYILDVCVILDGINEIFDRGSGEFDNMYV